MTEETQTQETQAPEGQQTQAEAEAEGNVTEVAPDPDTVEFESTPALHLAALIEAGMSINEEEDVPEEVQLLLAAAKRQYSHFAKTADAFYAAVTEAASEEDEDGAEED